LNIVATALRAAAASFRSAVVQVALLVVSETYRIAQGLGVEFSASNPSLTTLNAVLADLCPASDLTRHA
jgi:hypothetical protein